MRQIEEIHIEPSTSIFDVIASEYTFNSAVADLIDNCIDGGATVVKVFIDLKKFPYSLRVEDNGRGLSKEKLCEAAVIGFKDSADERHSQELGRYSTGLKSASSFLGDNVVVVSKQSGVENILKIDFAELKATKKWVAYFLDNVDFDTSFLNERDGTIVCCNCLKKMDSQTNMYDTIDRLKIYLNHIFGKFIIEDGLQLIVQASGGLSETLPGWNPFSLPGNKSTKCVLTKSQEFCGEKIEFKVYILPSFESLSNSDKTYMSGGGFGYNLNKLQGFYIYRSKRLISESGWLLPDLDITDKTRYARVEVNLPSNLDKYFGINLTKTKTSIPRELEPIFKTIAQKARAESNKNYAYKKHPEAKPSITKKPDAVWITVKTTQGTTLKLNKENVTLKELCKKMSEHEFDQLINLIYKSLPIGMIASQNFEKEAYTKQEIEEMAIKLYKSFRESGMSKADSWKKVSQTEPFNDEKCMALAIDAIDKIKEEELDD